MWMSPPETLKKLEKMIYESLSVSTTSSAKIFLKWEKEF